jgi:hypothetical protein
LRKAVSRAFLEGSGNRILSMARVASPSVARMVLEGGRSWNEERMNRLYPEYPGIMSAIPGRVSRSRETATTDARKLARMSVLKDPVAGVSRRGFMRNSGCVRG